MLKKPILTDLVVFDGAPSSGKSTAWRAFRKAGYQVSRPEVARKYITGEQRKGRKLADIVGNKAAMSYGIAEGMEAAELLLPTDELCFMDRGLPCCIAYCRLHGLDPAPVVAACGRIRYGMVFLFDRFPLKQDGVRHETEDEANFLDREIERAYKETGHIPIRVPVLSRVQRTLFIMSKVVDKLWEERKSKASRRKKP